MKKIALVVVEVRGGVVQNYTSPPGVAVRIVDWDDLKEEGLECPKCGSTLLDADTEAAGDIFVCEDCSYRFDWGEQDWEVA